MPGRIVETVGKQTITVFIFATQAYLTANIRSRISMKLRKSFQNSRFQRGEKAVLGMF